MKCLKLGTLFLGLVVSFPLYCDGKERIQIVKIGTILPLTGQISVYGNEVQNGIALAFEEYNSPFTNKGILVQLVSRDDQFSADKSVDAFRELAQQNDIIGIIGSVTSNCTLAIAKEAQEQGIPLLTPSSTNEHIIEIGDYIFQTCYKDSFQGRVAAQFGITRLGALKAVVLSDPANEYSNLISKEFMSFFADKSRVVTEISYSEEQTDFTSEIQRIKKERPDIIFFTNDFQSVKRMVEAFRAAGVDSRFIGTDAWDEIVFENIMAAEGSYYINHYSIEEGSAENRRFVTSYRNRWGKNPDALAALGYDSAKILLDAVTRMVATGNISRSTLRNEIARTNSSFVTGKTSFVRGRETQKTAIVLQIIQNLEKSGLETIMSSKIDPK